MVSAEEQFLLQSGVVIGAVRHLDEGERKLLLVESLSGESLSTAAIEGEILNRASVQSSLQRQLGLAAEKLHATAAEQGIAAMMLELHSQASDALTEAQLFAWHSSLMAGRQDLSAVGRYRTGAEPMQVVSGPIGRRRVHFEAPASSAVPAEMARFMAWFRQTSSQGKGPLPAVTRAAIAHLYFECIHPFEDGNGRIGRALAEKALAQGFQVPVLVSLAPAILARQKEYYAALEKANKSLELTEWMGWFAQITLEAQQQTLRRVQFVIAKTRLLDRLHGQLNERQQKAVLRLFKAGPEGFEGGLSAGNYCTVTGTSSATATRDLADLVEKGVFTRTGENRYARYALRLEVD